MKPSRVIECVRQDQQRVEVKTGSDARGLADFEQVAAETEAGDIRQRMPPSRQARAGPGVLSCVVRRSSPRSRAPSVLPS